MAMLYILTGLPYSGKTTLTNELVKRFGFDRVSTDDVIDARGYDVEAMAQEDWDSVYAEGYDKLIKLLMEGKTVVLDLGNLMRSERNTARRIAESLGCEYKLIYLDVPVCEIKERWAKNEVTQERGQLDEVTLERALGMFEEPASDECYVTYNQQMDLNKLLRENIIIQ